MQRTPGPTNIQRADTNTDLWQVSMREMGDLFKCLTVFNIEINVPILLLSQFSQLHKCRVIVVKMFRVRVEVVNPPPGFEVTEANKARTRLQEAVDRPQAKQHLIRGRVGEDEHLELSQGIVCQHVINVLVNNPVNRTDELWDPQVSAMLEKELKHLLREKLDVHFTFDTEVLKGWMYFQMKIPC